jgi:hypothetical protein
MLVAPRTRFAASNISAGVDERFSLEPAGKNALERLELVIESKERRDVLGRLLRLRLASPGRMPAVQLGLQLLEHLGREAHRHQRLRLLLDELLPARVLEHQHPVPRLIFHHEAQAPFGHHFILVRRRRHHVLLELAPIRHHSVRRL